MLQKFIDQTKDFLKRSDITIHELAVSEVEIGEDGKITHYLHLGDVFGKANISDNFLLHTMVFFTLADSQIDVNNPKLEGKNFSTRYRGLVAANDNDKIFKECYRILKIIRNSAIHSRSTLLMNDNVLSVNYTFKGTNFKLEISKLGLELIYTYLLGAYVPDKNPQEYKEAVARSIYDDICNEIMAIEDEFGKNLKMISGGLRIKRRRYRLMNTLFQQNNEFLKIITKLKKGSNPENIPIDYLVQLNGLNLTLPEEILNSDKSIPLNDILKWGN